MPPERETRLSRGGGGHSGPGKPGWRAPLLTQAAPTWLVGLMPQTVELEIGMKGRPGGGADYTDFDIAGISCDELGGFGDEQKPSRQSCL